MALPYLLGNPLQDSPDDILKWLQSQQPGTVLPDPSDIPEPGAALQLAQQRSQVPGAPGFVEPAQPGTALPQAVAQTQAQAAPTPAGPRPRALPKALGSVTTTAPTAPAPPTPPPAQTPGEPAKPQTAMEQMSAAYDKSDLLRNQAYDKLTPTDADLEGYRRSGTLGQLAGMAMQMLGNESQAAIGGNVLKQSMAEIEKGKRDPWKVGEMEAKKLEAQAAALEKRAQFAVTIEEKRDATKQANDLKLHAMQMRQDMAQSMLAMRGMTMGMTQQNQQQRNDQMIFQREHQLRSDYTKVTKDLTDAQRAAQQIISIVPQQVEKMNAQEQQALIFSFMKMLDPGSVVREAEYASAAKARGVLDTIGNYSTQLQSGKPLTPTQVRNMVKLGQTLMESSGELKRDINTQFEGTARGWGVDPRNFISGATLRTPDRSQPAPNRASDKPGAPPPDASVEDRGNFYMR